MDALQTVDRDSVIFLDAFPEKLQKAIVAQLGRRRCSRWVVLSNRATRKCGARQLLSRVGTEVDSLILGQLGGAQDGVGAEAWRTGDSRSAKLDAAYSVWVGGTGEHINQELWEAAWTLENKFTPPISQL